MAEQLHRLLGTNEAISQASIQQLERASGNPGHDVRLVAEIIGKSQLAVRSLGLDPRDSSDREVYAALMQLAELHEQFLRNYIGLVETATTDEILDGVVQLICKLHIPREVFVLKHSVVKRLLGHKPPKRTMKLLGYRSIPSMLKREPVEHVLSVALEKESATWKQAYYKLYDELKPTDFEQRPITVCRPKNRCWEDVGQSLSQELQTNVLMVPELGSIIVLPLPQRSWRGICLAVSVMTLLFHQELRMYSSFFKLQHLKPHFGASLAQALSGDKQHVAEVFGHDIQWRIVHTHFHTVGADQAADLLEPHLSLEDLWLRKVEDVLCSLEPAFSFWRGNEYVGGFFSTQQPVSFNLLDTTLNYVNNLDYQQRVISNMRSSLWDEILQRYFDNNYIRSLVLEQLSLGVLEVEV